MQKSNIETMGVLHHNINSVQYVGEWPAIPALPPDKGQHVSELKKTSSTDLSWQIQNENRQAIHRQLIGRRLQANVLQLVRNWAIKTSAEDEVKEDFFPILLVR